MIKKVTLYPNINIENFFKKEQDNNNKIRWNINREI